jgi:hypothetical protein
VPIIAHICSILFHIIPTVFCDREYLYQKYAGAKYDQLKAQLDPEGVLPRPRDPNRERFSRHGYTKFVLSSSEVQGKTVKSNEKATGDLNTHTQSHTHIYIIRYII